MTSHYSHDSILVLSYWIIKQDYKKKYLVLETRASLSINQISNLLPIPGSNLGTRFRGQCTDCASNSTLNWFLNTYGCFLSTHCTKIENSACTNCQIQEAPGLPNSNIWKSRYSNFFSHFQTFNLHILKFSFME